MRIAEFARMYQIPHTVVYNASFRVPFAIRRKYDGDYPHDELMKATREELKIRNEFHQSKLDKNNMYLKQLDKGCEGDA